MFRNNSREKKDKFLEIVTGYSEYSTIQGVIYVFQAGQSACGKVSWSLLVLSLFVLGSYWSYKSYNDWKTNPVLTTVMTTAYPINMIEFPAVTVCSSGLNQDIFISGMFHQFLKFWEDTTQNPPTLDPWLAEKLIYVKNTSEMNATEKAIVHYFSLIYYQNINSFINSILPGMNFFDPITDVIWLFSSKNPDLHIKSLYQTSTFSKYPKNLENFTSLNVNMSLNSQQATNLTFFDKTLNTNGMDLKNMVIDIVVNKFKSIFDRMNKTVALPNLVGALWYATMPCFDVQGITSDYDGQHSVLKICKWKGIRIPCSAIFTTFPTDKGMCCSFNMRPADEIFLERTYSSLINYLQLSDKNNSFSNSNESLWYENSEEPFPQAGQNKGLYVMLDSHSNLLAGGSSDSDFMGFTALIDSRGSYPLMAQKGFMIKPGHINMVALSATNIDATDDLRLISPKDRNCLFPDETSVLSIHQTYSQTNCLLECSILNAQKLMLMTNPNLTEPCIPWYLPFPKATVPVCDPWMAVKFETIMSQNTTEDVCSYCYPDCQNTIFEQSVTALPFKECDESNLGISELCNVEDPSLATPRIWGQAVIEEYQGASSIPNYIRSIESSTRTFSPDPVIFTKMKRSYKAYERDISVLQVFFDRPTIFKFLSQPSQTWVGFFSSIGGLLGLCLGISIVTIFELVWLGMRLTKTYLQPTKRREKSSKFNKNNSNFTATK